MGHNSKLRGQGSHRNLPHLSTSKCDVGRGDKRVVGVHDKRGKRRGMYFMMA